MALFSRPLWELRFSLDYQVGEHRLHTDMSIYATFCYMRVFTQIESQTNLKTFQKIIPAEKFINTLWALESAQFVQRPLKCPN